MNIPMHAGKYISPFLIIFLCLTDGFSPMNIAKSRFRHPRHLFMSDSPTIQELSADPFIKQVAHSESVIGELMQDPSGEGVQEKLSAMFSHPDGIRGFFVTYLTLDIPSDVMFDFVPDSLINAMSAADADVLIPLACMNVIMPTAMITMHQDEELSQQSRITAERGLKILRALMAENQPSREDVMDHCEAIQFVTSASSSTDSADDSDKRTYWTDFFKKWGYQELQMRDIAQAIESALQ